MSDTEALPVAETTEVETSAAEASEKTRQMSFATTDDGMIRADFGADLEPLVMNPAQLPEALISAAMIEGIMSRARGYTSHLKGADRTPAALRESIAKAFANMLQGVWEIERVGGGSTEWSIEVEAAHLFRVMREKAAGKEYTGTMAETAENFGKLTDEQKKQLKVLPRYQLALAEVKERRAAEKRAKLEKAVAAAEGEDAVF